MIAFDEFLGGWEKRSLSPGKLDLWHASTTVANFKNLFLNVVKLQEVKMLVFRFVQYY